MAVQTLEPEAEAKPEPESTAVNDSVSTPEVPAPVKEPQLVTVDAPETEEDKQQSDVTGSTDEYVDANGKKIPKPPIPYAYVSNREMKATAKDNAAANDPSEHIGTQTDCCIIL